MHAPARHRILGAAVAVTAAASVVAVPAAPVRAKTPRSAPVALAGLDGPVYQALLSVRVINNDLFNGQDVFGDYPWQPFQGLVAEALYTALPILSQMGFNGVEYIRGSVEALTDAGLILSAAASDLPAAVLTATRQLFSGHVADAVATLTAAIVVPIRNAGTAVLQQGLAVFGEMAGNIANVIAAVPAILRGLAATTIGSGRAVLSAAATIVTTAVKALADADLPAAWNAVVDGVFGPVGSNGSVTSSIPGTLIATTIGPGLGPQGYPSGYAVPSLRMWAERSQLTIADAVGAGYPVTSLGTRPAATHRTAGPTAVTGGRESTAAEKRAGTRPDRTVARHAGRAPRSESVPRPGASVRNRS